MATRLMLTTTDQTGLLAWANSRLGGDGAHEWGWDARALGVIERDTGRVVFVAVFNAFYDGSCHIHQISDGSRAWATRATLRGIFTFGFDVCGVTRILAVTPHENRAALEVVKRTGFQFEARLRTTASGKSGEIVATMFREECPWLTSAGRQAQGQDVPEPTE